jgi:hypothetical protein
MKWNCHCYQQHDCFVIVLSCPSCNNETVLSLRNAVIGNGTSGGNDMLMEAPPRETSTWGSPSDAHSCTLMSFPSVL